MAVSLCFVILPDGCRPACIRGYGLLTAKTGQKKQASRLWNACGVDFGGGR